jgi:hypothetical protein
VPKITPPLVTVFEQSSMVSTSVVHITCLCGAVSEPGTLLEHREFPVAASICHCNVCRRTTGSFGASFPPLISSLSKTTVTRLTAYKSSEKITRYFCSSCGCHCFLFHHPRNKWYCLGGVIEKRQTSKTSGLENITEVKLHEYVSDTVDGGLTYLLSNLGGRSIPVWSDEPGSLEISHEKIQSQFKDSIKTLLPSEKSSYLPAKCHCGGVSLMIKRANYDSKATANLPARYIPSDPTKWLSYFCTCRSCRLSFGVSLTPWTMVLPAHVFNANHTQGNIFPPVTFGRQDSDTDANVGLTLKHYWSSPDVCRSFCGKCGASVSYWSEKRPDELDMASGIFRAEEGSMARRWLEWVWGRCSSTEEAIDKDICDAWVASPELIKILET